MAEVCLGRGCRPDVSLTLHVLDIPGSGAGREQYLLGL